MRKITSTQIANREIAESCATRTLPRRSGQAPESMPSAGPHARPDLTDKDKTPGTGMLLEPGDANPSPTG
ncbi:MULTISPECIES: hypothetical protein [unclassified Bradyrhizobium]|uniref:hypothetical protein n=1 Tax=unclassified Bradyrhizobium TaxID=2631580 RepID=UPI0028ED912D|nr:MULTISPECIES: hypothetical protein [unclassified Bradyrhizobium]